MAMKKKAQKGQKAGKKAATAKKGRVTLPPDLAKKARGMLSQIRGWYEDAKDNKKGKAGTQRKLVF